MKFVDKRKILKSVIYLFIGLIFVWIFMRIMSDADKIDWQNLHIKYIPLSASIVILAAAYLIRSAVWTYMLRFFGGDVSMRQGMKVFLLTQAGRYIPGKIWQFAGAGFLGKRFGISADVSVTTTFIAVLFNQTVGLILSILLLRSVFVGQFSIYIGGIALLICALAFLASPLFPKCINWAAKLIGKKTNIAIKKMPLQVVVLFLLAYVLIWGMFGIGFVLLAKSFFPNTDNLLFLNATGALAAACVLGFFSILTPSGLGVRELVLAFALTPFIGKAEAGILAIAARLWMTIVEFMVMGWAVIPFLTWYKNKKMETEL